MSDFASARTRYREAALDYWVYVEAGDADAANEEARNGDAIVQELETLGKVVDLLEPLLKDADPEVRFAAASDLLDRGVEEAARVLEELAADPKGLIAPTAHLRLVTDASQEVAPPSQSDIPTSCCLTVEPSGGAEGIIPYGPVHPSR